MVKVAYIGYESLLSPMINRIKELAKRVPVESLEFTIFPSISPEDVLEKLILLENIVSEYVSKGFTHIGIPAISTLISPYILGYENIPALNIRWPDTVFMVQGTGTTVVKSIPNLYRFKDINTVNNSSLVKFNLSRWIKNAGKAYVVYQGAGDVVSTELMETAVSTLNELKITTEVFEIGLPDDRFDSSKIRETSRYILEDAPPNPSVSVVIHIVNVLKSDQYSREIRGSNLGLSFRNNLENMAFGNEYAPELETLPYDLHLGRIPIYGLPSLEAESLGIPLDPSDYYDSSLTVSYLDSYLWAATDRKTDGINYKQLKLDSSGTIIDYYLADVTISKNSTRHMLGPYHLNPRWWNEDSEVVVI